MFSSRMSAAEKKKSDEPVDDSHVIEAMMNTLKERVRAIKLFVIVVNG